MPSLNLRRALAAAAVTAAVAVPAAPAGASVVPTQLPCVPGVTCTTPEPACPGGGVVPTRENLAAVRRATLCLVNEERTKHGLAKLHANRALRGVATRYARRMVAQSFFDHVAPTGSTFVQRILASSYVGPRDGYSLGENLAWGAGELATPRLIVRAWMNSPGHRANILNGAYRDVGVGVTTGIPVAGGGVGATYVNEFGTRS